jgi:oxygen-independent coproporphyrinogen-3 oxidase
MFEQYFDIKLIKKYQVNTPRYTSYPTADKFNTNYNINTHNENLENILLDDKNFSLYIHIPFCNTLCLFCGCNKIITNKREKITVYLNYLEKEMQLLYEKSKKNRINISQLHFGGGSPSWLSKEEITRLMNILNKYFNYSFADEIAIEVDPRHTNADYINNLKNIGFNRISIGVQDFNALVQKAINRIQPYELTRNVLQACKDMGFKSTSVDLIYGLPLQTLESFTNTIDQIIELKPDRISLFNYAHIPNVVMSQTRINEKDLPNGDVKLDILQISVNKLTQAGYIFIGMDHFALPNDPLALALNNGTMQRNFQGYSINANLNLLSLGVSAIGMINNNYFQNYKILEDYYRSLDNNLLPIYRGFSVSNDDVVRKYVIDSIMCQFKVDYKLIENKYNIDFCQYFVAELKKLDLLVADGLIKLVDNGFIVSERGRFLVRNVAVIFDKYYALNTSKIFSKAI